MPKKEQPTVSSGVLSLLGVNDLAPSAEIDAIAAAAEIEALAAVTPDDPEDVHVETIAERQAREHDAREAARRVLSAGTQKFDDTVEMDQLPALIEKAEAYRDECTRNVQAANARYLEARDTLDRLKARRDTVDTRSDEEVNSAYARRMHEMRMEQHQRVVEQQADLRVGGKLTSDDMARITANLLSPVDRAMAQKVTEARRAR